MAQSGSSQVELDSLVYYRFLLVAVIGDLRQNLVCSNSMNEVKFKFSTPEHGWMDINVSDGKQEISLEISDVPFDSIYKLASVLLGLQSGLRSDEFEFSLEPGYARWKFISQGNNLELHIFPDSGRDRPIVFASSRGKLLHSLYMGLRDLESLQCWKEQNAGSCVWSWEFPSTELNEFKLRSKSA
jgi:hypothetical protein